MQVPWEGNFEFNLDELSLQNFNDIVTAQLGLPDPEPPPIVQVEIDVAEPVADKPVYSR